MIGSTSKAYSFLLFLLFGLLFLFIAVKFQDVFPYNLLDYLFGILFLIESILIISGRRIAFVAGYSLMGLLCILVIVNFIIYGEFGFGILLLAGMLMGVKYLSDYHQYADQFHYSRMYGREFRESLAEDIVNSKEKTEQ